MAKPITAKRKDGTAAAIGDRVFVIWDNDKKMSGRIAGIGEAMRFDNGPQLQTYNIKCRDGITRPAHAWHIKGAYSNVKRRA